MKRPKNSRPPASQKRGAPSGPSEIPGANRPMPPRPRRWLFRLLAMTLIPLLCLGGLEVVLRLVGYGYNPDYFLPLRIGNEAYLVQNEDFSRRFFPGEVSRQPAAIRMKAHKPPGALRLFVLGESAAMGDPEPAFGPARYLEVLLRERYPDQEIEVVNVAFTAINSHVVLPIARECARHDGDVWIVYLGNNEMVGPFGAATVFGAQSPPLRYVRWSLALQRTRLGQLGREWAGRWQSPGTAAPSWQGMQMFLENRVPPDSPKRAAAYRNFTGNLQDVLAAGLDSGARVLLNTMAVNLRESPPFASLPDERLSAANRARFDDLLIAAAKAEQAGAWAEAAGLLREAVTLDATFAEAHYRLAGCLGRAGDSAGALAHYQLACDTDALPFRADSSINHAIRQAAARQVNNGLQVLDAAEEMAKFGGGTPCGDESFYEHVHFNFDGAYRLGLAWAQAVERMGLSKLAGRSVGEWPSQEACERRLGLTDWNRKLVAESMIRRLQQPPLSSQPNNPERLRRLQEQEQALLAGMNPEAVARARALCAEVIAAHPDDHFLRESHASFLQLTGDVPGAIREWRVVGELLPHDFLPWFQVGVLSARLGQHAEAQAQFRRALLIRPGLVEGWLELGRSLGAEQKWEPAAAAFERACASRPQDPVLWASRARATAELGRRAEAIEFYQRAIKLRPEYWEARGALGDQLAQAGQTPEAMAQYEAAILIKPDYAMGHLNLGVMQVRQGRIEPAIQHFQEALRLEPDNATAAEYLQRVQARPLRQP